MAKSIAKGITMSITLSIAKSIVECIARRAQDSSSGSWLKSAQFTELNGQLEVRIANLARHTGPWFQWLESSHDREPNRQMRTVILSTVW